MLYVSFPTPREKKLKFQGMRLILYCWDKSDRTFWNLLAPKPKKNTSSHDPPPKKNNSLQTNQQKNPVERFAIMATRGWGI